MLNIKEIKTGKGLIETLTETENVEGNDSQAAVTEGLPVFNDRNYASNLSQLLSCRDLEHSFDIAHHSPKYDLFVNAMDFLQELNQIIYEEEDDQG